MSTLSICGREKPGLQTKNIKFDAKYRKNSQPPPTPFENSRIYRKRKETTQLVQMDTKCAKRKEKKPPTIEQCEHIDRWKWNRMAILYVFVYGTWLVVQHWLHTVLRQTYIYIQLYNMYRRGSFLPIKTKMAKRNSRPAKTIQSWWKNK